MSRALRLVRASSVVALLVTLSCTDTAQSTADAGADASADTGPDAGTGRAHLAKVFPINPVATPAELVDLGGLADDAGGVLTSAADKNGIRRLAVFSCADEGATHTVPGAGVQRICTLRQRANSEQNGTFVYEDWTNAARGAFDATDVHAEVSLYYHANKIYDFISSPDVGLGEAMAARHLVNGKPVPLTLVANYQLPVSQTQNALAPANFAATLPREMGSMGMWKMRGLTGISGDVLMFGQGPKADFAYDGETVYHEFGHWISGTTAKLSYLVQVDDYGLDNSANALAEGISDTFAFLVSGRAQLFDYLDKTTGPFTRDLSRTYRAPQDMVGQEVADGMVVGSANWSALQALKKDAGFTDRRFARVLGKALSGLARFEGRVNLARYGDAFLEALAQDGAGDAVTTVRRIFTAQGFYEVVRARDISSFQGGGAQDSISTGGVVSMPWNTFLTMDGTAISPAYVQSYVDAGPAASRVTLSATQIVMPGQSQTDLAYKLFVRRGSPILYTPAGTGSAVTVTMDEAIEPVLTNGQPTWTLTVSPGTRTYLHFVNYGQASGVLARLRTVMN